MTSKPALTKLRYVLAPSVDQRRGLLGWCSCRYGSLILDGISLRRTLDGRLCLSFPARTDRKGRQHPIVRPVDDASRAAFEAAVFDALALQIEAKS
jgi:hypothetical protein